MKEWHPPKLGDNLYYVNSFESVVSTMETEMISARNVSLLIAKSLGRITSEEDNFNVVKA